MKFEDVKKMFGPYVGAKVVGIVGQEGGRRVEVCFEDEDGALLMLTFWDYQGGGYNHGWMSLLLGTASEYVARNTGFDGTPVVTQRTEPAD